MKSGRGFAGNVVVIHVMMIVGMMCVLTTTASPARAQGDAMPTLKDTFRGDFLVGAAIGRPVLNEPGQVALKLVGRQFNTITSTNMLKWGPFNPAPGTYRYEPADRYVQFGSDHNMYVVGHVLFWHNQTPDWVFEDNAGNAIGREALLDRMRQRVQHVAQRYGRRIHAWDVVNESITDAGSLRNSPWTRIIGEDFIEQAFRIADAQLPSEVELFYNDYSMTGKRKRDAVVKMVRDFKARGVRIDGVGMQGHWSIDGPSIEAIEASIIAFAEAGVQVHITELDIDVLPRKAGMWGNADVKKKLAQDPAMNPYPDGLPDEIQAKLAKRYAEIFALFAKHRDKIKRVTFWGTTDRYSWLNNWPIKGRTNYPLLFDREGRPKPAFEAVVEFKAEQDQSGD